nr:peroxisome proliferator-activated receptor gamma coactivator-related protein 1-like [Cherax quadricarinatus]
MASTVPPWASTSYHEGMERSLRLERRAMSFSSLENQGRRHQWRSGSSTPPSTPSFTRRSTPSYSCHTTPTASRRSRLLGVPRQSTESLPDSRSSSRAGTPLLSSRQRSRSRSPRPRMESDALETPGVQQEAITRALLYPSTLHHNLRVVGILVVMGHVCYKTLVPWLLTPLLKKFSLDWTVHSVVINIPPN